MIIHIDNHDRYLNIPTFTIEVQMGDPMRPIKEKAVAHFNQHSGLQSSLEDWDLYHQLNGQYFVMSRNKDFKNISKPEGWEPYIEEGDVPPPDL